MSLRQTPNAILRGYAGPLYPVTMKSVARASFRQDGKSIGDPNLKRAAQMCSGFVRMTLGLVTDDGYLWHHFVLFDVPHGQVGIAIPMMQDPSCADGSRFDRSPAAYTRGLADIRDAEAAAAQLARAICKVRSENSPA